MDKIISIVDKKSLDGFKNVLKGLGGSKDAREYNAFQMGLRITQQLANDLYVYNWLAAKVIDVPIDDATRKWRTLLISDPEKKDLIEKSMKSFNVKNHINLAEKWARVFGGSVIIAIIEGQNMEEPLMIDSIRPGSLKRFMVLDRYNIYPVAINRDIMSDNFAQPEYYNVVRGGQRIHHTRLTKLQGSTPTFREVEENNYWGTSILTKLWEPISDSQTTSQSIANLIYESNIDVYKINGFNAMVAEGSDDLVVKRLKLAHEMKSIINGIALDSEDEYDKKSNVFASLPDIDDRMIQKVSGASNIPVTKLIGISPSGMNATGESDMYNYYDFVQAIQENDLRPHIDWMDSIVLANDGYKDEFSYNFKPLKQLTEIEQADVDTKNATRDQVYLDHDIVLPSDVMAQLAENGTYVTIDENRLKAEKEAEELDVD